MIRSGELQQRNIIKVKHDGHWRTVKVTATFRTFIMASNPYTHIGMAHDYDINIHGARISLEWLNSYGWHYIENDKNGNKQVSLKHCPFIIAGYPDGTLHAKLQGTRFDKEFQYLHELQNLFHAITGKELFSDTQLKPILSLE